MLAYRYSGLSAGCLTLIVPAASRRRRMQVRASERVLASHSCGSGGVAAIRVAERRLGALLLRSLQRMEHCQNVRIAAKEASPHLSISRVREIIDA